MLRLGCNRCGEIFESSARRVDFPVYCDECFESMKFIEAMKPSATVPEPEPVTVPEYANCVPNHTSDCAVSMTPAMPASPCDCGHATVENTTELISDLEDQLAQQKQLVTFLEGREHALLNQTEQLGRDKFALSQTIAEMIGDATAAAEYKQTMATAVLEAGRVVTDLLSRLDVLREATREAQRKAKFQTAIAVRLSERIKQMMKADPPYKRLASERFGEILELRNEIRELKTRGIFGRLFARD